MLVFGLWYPGLYRLLAGGRELFLLVTSVDVALGPLLTFAVFNLEKGWPHLRRDLIIIGSIQLAALIYGMHTVYVARPVAMVFEVDRFRVLSAVQVEQDELPKARPEYRHLPLTGPLLLGTRAPNPGDERNDALFKSLAGVDLAQRPIFWQPYAESSAAALAKSRPLAQLIEHYADRATELRGTLRALNVDESKARFLPLTARGNWVVVLDAAGNVSGYLPVDGFF